MILCDSNNDRLSEVGSAILRDEINKGVLFQLKLDHVNRQDAE